MSTTTDPADNVRRQVPMIRPSDTTKWRKTGLSRASGGGAQPAEYSSSRRAKEEDPTEPRRRTVPSIAMIAFIDDHRKAYGVEPICRVLPIAPCHLITNISWKISLEVYRFLLDAREVHVTSG